MIYLIGGSPRAGKTLLTQALASKLKIGWVSTDLLYEVLRAKEVSKVKQTWDASPDAIITNADWFFPCLQRFVRGANDLSEDYIIEGVDILPKQASELAASYPIRALFIGNSHMTLDKLSRFPGCSKGYAFLPDETKTQIVHDVPQWSRFIQGEAQKYNFHYIDTAEQFNNKLEQAIEFLLQNSE